jgi:hypothetical protein
MIGEAERYFTPAFGVNDTGAVELNTGPGGEHATKQKRAKYCAYFHFHLRVEEPVSASENTDATATEVDIICGENSGLPALPARGTNERSRLFCTQM